jgi:transposase
MDRARRSAVAPDAQRSAAVGDRLPADPPLDRRRRVRLDGRRSARVAARRTGARACADSGDPGLAHDTVDARERGSCRIRRAKRRKGSKVHVAVDTLGHLLALKVTAADEQDRAQVADLCAAVQEATGETVEVAFVDQGYTGDQAREDAEGHGIRLEVVKLPEAKKGFVLLPRRWVVERSFGWAARFRRLARDYERLPDTLGGLQFLAFAMLMAHRLVPVITQSH